jgi:putative transposase
MSNRQNLSYKFRLLPNKRQHVDLRTILSSQRDLYNAALLERIDCYRKTGKSLFYIDQAKSISICRKEIPEMASLPANLQRGTLARLDRAFKGFFCRLKRGDNPGFPRFRGRDWFNGFEFAEFSGIRFADNRLCFKGIRGGLRVHMHRSLPEGKILCAKFKRDIKGWSVCLVISVETAEKRIVSSAVGIDVGIKTLAATSDGLLIPNPRCARKAEREMRLYQRQLARCKRGSKRRMKVKQRVARLHAKTANTRNTGLHQISRMLVNRYDVIAVEALNNKALAKGMLARDVNDAGWSKLREYLRYKAEGAGAHFIQVDPKYTSQICPDCGTVAKKELSERVHGCACGCVLDRDVAAAQVILQRAVVGAWGLNVGQKWAERATGNINLSARTA